MPKSYSSKSLCSRSGCKISVCAMVYRNSLLNFRVKHPTTWHCASAQLYLPQKPTRVFYRREETLLTIQYKTDIYNSGASIFFKIYLLSILTFLPILFSVLLAYYLYFISFLFPLFAPLILLIFRCFFVVLFLVLTCFSSLQENKRSGV